jgi:hypothetical protein
MLFSVNYFSRYLLRVPRRHQALHYQRTTQNVCHGCGKTFSRLDALNVSSRFYLIEHPFLTLSLLSDATGTLIAPL